MSLDPTFILQGVLVLLIGAGIRGIYARQEKTLALLEMIDKRLIRVEEWQVMHQESDRREFETVRRELNQMRGKY